MKTNLIFLTIILINFGLTAQNYSDYLGAGHDQGITITTSHSESSERNVVNGSGLNRDLLGASRFLSQATLGVNLEHLIYTDSIGYEAWLEEQFSMPISAHLQTVDDIVALIYPIYIEAGNEPEDFETNLVFSRSAWWHNATQSSDLLRNKIAFALSEILVLSDRSDLAASGRGLAHYYDILSRHSFGNYKDLLLEVTLNPSMGFYLSHLNNPKSFPELNIHPDENYAREFMQLFTIGLYELNLDGTRKLGSDGLFIPTYDNKDITELAKVFTGLSAGAWVDSNIQEPLQFGIPLHYTDLTVPMRMWEEWHETGAKSLINDFVIPDGQNGFMDIEMAVDHLFHHANVGPFLATHLIKRLIKSNPSAAYVQRVASVFNENELGIRGDMKSVIAAILLDEEARSCVWIDQFSNGKLREPVHRFLQYLRAFNVKTEGEFYLNQGFNFEYLNGQHPLSSPTVFNFFLPDYQPNGEIADAELTAPEFQIFNSSTSIGYVNAVQFWVLLDYLNELPNLVADNTDNMMAYFESPILDFFAGRPQGITDFLDLVFAQGQLSEETKSIINDVSSNLDDPTLRVKMATFLTMISPDFAIMK